jgi:Arc/MetJ-type ribon-helix-helix transcriptional regulator
MTITLMPDQLKWLESQVAGGRFDSVQDAVRLAVAGLMTLDADDLARPKPLVDEARASIARGEGIPAEAVRAQLDTYLKSIGTR